ncbi:hypothetical protein AGOR_G00181670 [Albula goreensis]|uniref:Cytoskeleton-associated protein 4 n=1 Tax=Albula goreensis TaxID=1534307 RepID=A0A8T3CWJ2_9TELE|nr:hypothetical protein AGOR_G00181670 [Albula goreensis]
MPAKHRNKSNTSDKNPTSNQDDVAKKIPKASKESDSSGSGSGSWAKVLAALSYIALVAAAGFAAFYLQRVVEEVGQINSRTEESIQKNAELTKKMESVLQQVDSLSQTVDGFDTALSRMRTELESTGWAVRKGEAETRRVEEALQKLQNELLRDLSDGIQEVKEAREQDSASLERTVEERLTELTRSIGDSVAEFTEAQGETQGQLKDLKVRLDSMDDPSSLKRELLAITETVGELHTASQAAENTAESLRTQIDNVRAELQIRNQEVASTAQEIESVRELVQNTAGVLRQAVTEAESSVKALTDQTQTLQSGLDLAVGSIQSLEEGLRGAVSHAEKSGEEVEARLKAVEQSAETSGAAVSQQTARMESLLSKYDSHESVLATLGRDLESVRSAGEAEAVKLQAALKEAQQALRGRWWHCKQVESLGKKLNALEKDTSDTQALEHLKNSVSQAQKDMQQLRTTVNSLTAYSKKVEGNEKAISSLKSALEETKASVSKLSKPRKV